MKNIVKELMDAPYRMTFEEIAAAVGCSHMSIRNWKERPTTRRNYVMSLERLLAKKEREAAQRAS